MTSMPPYKSIARYFTIPHTNKYSHKHIEIFLSHSYVVLKHQFASFSIFIASIHNPLNNFHVNTVSKDLQVINQLHLIEYAVKQIM